MKISWPPDLIQKPAMPNEPAQTLSEPATRLLEFWKASRTGDAAPSHAALNPSNLREWMNDSSIVEFHTGEKKLCLKMQGLNVARNIGDYHAPGGYLEDLVPADVQAIVLEPYYQAHRTGRPVYSVIKQGILKGAFNQFERLILPFTNEASGTVDRFFVWVGPTDRDALDCETIYDTPLSQPFAAPTDKGDSQLVIIE